jgi:hypothetical protein
MVQTVTDPIDLAFLTEQFTPGKIEERFVAFGGIMRHVLPVSAVHLDRAYELQTEAIQKAGTEYLLYPGNIEHPDVSHYISKYAVSRKADGLQYDFKVVTYELVSEDVTKMLLINQVEDISSLSQRNRLQRSRMLQADGATGASISAEEWLSSVFGEASCGFSHGTKCGVLLYQPRLPCSGYVGEEKRWEGGGVPGDSTGRGQEGNKSNCSE